MSPAQSPDAHPSHSRDLRGAASNRALGDGTQPAFADTAADLVLDVAPASGAVPQGAATAGQPAAAMGGAAQAGGGASSPPAPVGNSTVFAPSHAPALWWLAGLLNAGVWPSRWTRAVAQSQPPGLLAVVLGGAVTLGLACACLWWLAPAGVRFTIPGVLWSGWGLLACVLWLAVLTQLQGWQGESARQRFWAAVALSMGGLAAAVLWWAVVVWVIDVLGEHNRAVQHAWDTQVGLWVAVWLAALAFIASAWVSLRRGWALALGCLGFVVICWATAVLTPFLPWWSAQPEDAFVEEPVEAVQLALSQAVLERQQQAFVRASQALQPRDPKRINLYGLVFAPFAGEAVFRNETRMLEEVLGTRFDAQGRVFTLLNHYQTAETMPWATRENLFRAVWRLSQVMDKERDILLVYLTSHGGRDHKLAAQLAPLSVQPLEASDLRVALDMVGIRHRVIAVSACYSGGWIPALRGDSTLVMTAADATHTSYGCGHGSELTYFGRAVFNEQLRQTRSFETAFRQAVPIIAQREQEAGKDDGFSNPQIHVGQRMAAYLKRFEAQWPQEAAVAVPALPAVSAPAASAPAKSTGR